MRNDHVPMLSNQESTFDLCFWGDGEAERKKSSFSAVESEGSWSLDIKCHSQDDRDLIPRLLPLCLRESVFIEKVSEGPLSFFSPISEDFNV